MYRYALQYLKHGNINFFENAFRGHVYRLVHLVYAVLRKPRWSVPEMAWYAFFPQTDTPLLVPHVLVQIVLHKSRYEDVHQDIYHVRQSVCSPSPQILIFERLVHSLYPIICSQIQTLAAAEIENPGLIETEQKNISHL